MSTNPELVTAIERIIFLITLLKRTLELENQLKDSAK